MTQSNWLEDCGDGSGVAMLDPIVIHRDSVATAKATHATPSPFASPIGMGDDDDLDADERYFEGDDDFDDDDDYEDTFDEFADDDELEGDSDSDDKASDDDDL